MSQRRDVYVRQWRIIEALNGTRFGLTVAQLVQRVGASRATIYRDVTLLMEVGFPIDKSMVNSEARYRIDDHPAAPLRLSPLQLSAIHFARERLTPLEGTSVVRELDRVLAQAKEKERPALALSLGDAAHPTPRASAAIERALRDRRRLRFVYAGVKERAASERHVDPLALHLSDNHLYLAAYDLDKEALRTFKLVRMSDVEVLSEPASRHDEYDTGDLFADAVKAWSGEVIEVRVRVPARLARFADEWPLVEGQTITETGDGFAIVIAEVAGLIEPMRWVLRWGGDAVVLSPPELGTMVVAELRRALEGYESVNRGEEP